MSAVAAAAVLNVGLTATKGDVDRAFRQLARLCHPDRLTDSSAAQLTAAHAEFTRACDARDVLHARLRSAPATPPPTARAPSGSAPGASRPTYESTPPRPSATAPRSAHRAETPPQQPAARQPKTMSFAEFVAARDAASWVYASPVELPSARPRRGRTPHPRRWPTPARRYHFRSSAPVILGVLAVIGVGIYVAGLWGNPAVAPVLPALPLPPVAADLLADASVVQVDDAALYESNCQTDLGCWIWSVTARAECPAATITVGFSDTADGAGTSTSTTQSPVQAEVPFLIVEHAPDAASQYARIESISC